MTRSNAILAIMAVLTAATVPSTEAAFSQEEGANIFKEYDVVEENSADCREDDGFDEQFCPNDETIPCAEISQIEAHCESVLGDFAVAGLPTDTGVNALEGCVRYVGYHVFDNSHIACCQSDICEDWIDEQFDKMEDQDDDDDIEDDDDDYYPEGEDDDDDEF